VSVSLLAAWVTIVVGATSFMVVVAGVVGFFIRKKQRLAYLRWRLGSDLRLFDLDRGFHFREATGYTGPMTLYGLRDAIGDKERLRRLEALYVDIHREALVIVDLSEEYVFWGRVFGFGNAPDDLS